ncbi:hypothetical protein AB0I61_17395 [Polymorphospora rubra]|uniref:hypothetical protein n=1 Tax=Polymorphospora rubra TaxID=338584 RepID=UPI0033FFD479
MARSWFGGRVPDFVIAAGTDFEIAPGVVGKVAVLVGGVEHKLWNEKEGGTQYTDLLNEEGAAISTVTSLPMPAIGSLPRFQGPDDVKRMYISAADGPRFLILADDAGGGSVSQEQLDALVANDDYTEQGAILVATDTGQPTALEVGPAGTVLTADPSEPTGVRWASAAASSGNMLVWREDLDDYWPPELKAKTDVGRIFAGAVNPETVDGVEFNHDWDLWVGAPGGGA